jgi:hypothetical protein
MLSLRSRWCAICVLAISLAFPALLSAQGTGGRILGRVADPSGAVLGGVSVTATNEATGVTRNTKTNDTGDYVFPDLPVGTYTLSFELSGFKKELRRSISLDINQVITLNMTMQLGAAQEVVDVTSEAPLVDTTSTQLGAVVNNRSVNELPLNERDTYQFLQLQPGVQSQLGSSGSTFYGSDKAGSVSVNGGRGRANNFNVNGGDANDQFVNLPTVQPTPDAIEEFRVITNTFDAEYGRNSGAVVNVVTKSGTNSLHGNVYEYFRNTVLDGKGFLNTTRPQWNQNQFGGTLGGPIKKDRTFFFGSYEGRRVREGISGQEVFVPTPDELGGNFSIINGGTFPLTRANGTPNQITDQFVADALNARTDGTTTCQQAISNLGGATPAAAVSWASIFPTGVIPSQCMDPVAVNLMQRYVPGSNRPDGSFQAVPVKSDTQDQFTIRVDHRINDHQNFSMYYYYTDDRDLEPFYNFQYSGANVPGYGVGVGSRYQQWNPSHAWTITNSLVNEFHFTYMREGQLTFQHPANTGPVSSFCSGAAAAYCFTGTSDSSVVNAFISSQGVAPGRAGIMPGLPSNRTGLPFINVSGGFNIGNGWEGELPQVGNSFQWADNLSWVKGPHTLKFGGDVRRSRFDQTLYYNVNGNFTFNGTGVDAIASSDNYPGYLLGLADTYTQGSAQRENVRSTGVYLFAQDSWKVKPNVTLNYGLRWELDTPLTDILRHVQTFRPGETSKVYPCTNTPLANCPTGLVFPGDPGVPAGLTSTYYKAFAPRIGLSYSPNATHGPLGKLFGSNGKTSIRMGWGLFYNPIEQLVLEQFGAEPPFGGSPSFSNVFFNTPFVDLQHFVSANGFNGIVNPVRGQDPGWSNYSSTIFYGEFQPHLRTQYTAQYNFGVQRELARDIVLSLNYVGTQGHRLLASHDINPSNAQTCLDINTYVGPNTCGPVGEDTTFNFTLPANMPFHLPNGQVITGAAGGTPIYLVGLRPYSSPNCVTNGVNAGTNCPTSPVFASIFAEDTIAASSYNALQAMLEKRLSRGVSLQAAYTWSKSLDWASTFEETLNPFNFKASRALSLFNSAQRFVLNYVWDLPIPRYSGAAGKILDDWQISGITQFQSGFPIRLQTQDDAELINSLFFLGTAAPQLTGPLQLANPKTPVQLPNGQIVHYYLTTSQFSDPPRGQFSTTPRSICCGPGLNQWDVTISKKVLITENKYFQFRADIFNVANRTAFFNPDGNFSDSTFGQVLQARDPRLVQFALKFYF